MSTSTLPRARGTISGYCWARNPHGAGRCTLPAGHAPGTGGDDHRDPYNKARWQNS